MLHERPPFSFGLMFIQDVLKDAVAAIFEKSVSEDSSANKLMSRSFREKASRAGSSSGSAPRHRPNNIKEHIVVCVANKTSWVEYRSGTIKLRLITQKINSPHNSVKIMCFKAHPQDSK